MTMIDEAPLREVITDLADLDSSRLSYRARGVLLHLTATYAPETQISARALVGDSEAGVDGEGAATMRKVLSELERHGYLRRGRGTAWVWRGDPTRWTA